MNGMEAERRRRVQERRLVVTPALLAGLALAYITLSLLIWRVADPTETAAPWWPAAGLTLGVLCLTARRDWPTILLVIFAADIAADLIEGTALPTSLGWAAANTLEPLLGALAMRVAFPGAIPNIESPTAVARLFLVAALAGTPIASLIGGATSALSYDTPFLETWRTWYVGDVLGILVVLPVVLYAQQIRATFSRVFLGVLAAAALLVALVFLTDALPIYLVTPMLVIVAMTLGAPGAVTVSLLTATAAYLVSSGGHGPFALGEGDLKPLTDLQVFTAVQLLTAFLVVALRSELLSARARVSVLSEEQLRDPLTGTGNRLRIEDALVEATSETTAGAVHSVAVLYVDLDAFKPVNDRYGHHAGDTVLCTIAARLEEAVRESDTVGRIGGDEFVVVCRDITPAELDQLAVRLRQRVAAPIRVNGSELRVGASVGTSWSTDAVVPPAELLRRADLDMYQRKVSRPEG